METKQIAKSMHDIPEPVRWIIGRLAGAGYEAFLVGGCVRDCLLGIQPADYDIATAAQPQDVKRVFAGAHILDTGIKHGTVSLERGGAIYEITTFRVDGAYTDGRRPDSVTFSSRIEEDLARRDFTINAMAYNDQSGLIDPFGGRADLAAGLVRAVGVPARRFGEDKLRALRAFRFAAALDFKIERNTKESAISMFDADAVAAERIQAEINRIFTAPGEPAVRDFIDSFSPVLFPALHMCKGQQQHNLFHQYDVYGHTLTVFFAVPKELTLRLAALYHDVGKPSCRTKDAKGTEHFYGHAAASERYALEFLRRFRYSTEVTKTVAELVLEHDSGLLKPDTCSMRRLLSRFGGEQAVRLVRLKRADISGQSDWSRRQNLPRIEECARLLNAIIEREGVTTLKELAVDGRDVQTVGARGAFIGETLNYLLEQVLEEPKLNEKARLLELAAGFLQSNGTCRNDACRNGGS